MADVKKMKLHGLTSMVSSPPSSAELKSAEAEDCIHLRSYDQSLLRRRITCDDMFMVQSKDEKELMDMARQHIKNIHEMDVTDDDLRAKMEVV